VLKETRVDLDFAGRANEAASDLRAEKLRSSLSTSPRPSLRRDPSTLRSARRCRLGCDAHRAEGAPPQHTCPRPGRCTQGGGGRAARIRSRRPSTSPCAPENRECAARPEFIAAEEQGEAQHGLQFIAAEDLPLSAACGRLDERERCEVQTVRLHPPAHTSGSCGLIPSCIGAGGDVCTPCCGGCRRLRHAVYWSHQRRGWTSPPVVPPRRASAVRAASLSEP